MKRVLGRVWKEFYMTFAIVVFCISGCTYGQIDEGDEAPDYRPICEAMYYKDYIEKFDIDLSRLSEIQNEQLKDKYMKYCLYDYAPVPVCIDEQYAYYTCRYIDNSTALQNCKNTDDALDICKENNQQQWDVFYSEYVSPENAATTLLNSWGFNDE